MTPAAATNPAGLDTSVPPLSDPAEVDRRYRYYRCLLTIKRGAHACSTGAVTALALERQVVQRIREFGRDPQLVAEVVRQARFRVDERRQVLRKEQRRIKSTPSARTPRIREIDVAAALARFDGVWDALLPSERSRVFELMVERVDYGPDTQAVIQLRAA